MKNYLRPSPASYRRTGRGSGHPRLIDPFGGVIDSWLRAEIKIKAKTIDPRSFTRRPLPVSRSYLWIKEYVRVMRP